MSKDTLDQTAAVRRVATRAGIDDLVAGREVVEPQQEEFLIHPALIAAGKTRLVNIGQFVVLELRKAFYDVKKKRVSGVSMKQADMTYMLFRKLADGSMDSAPIAGGYSDDANITYTKSIIAKQKTADDVREWIQRSRDEEKAQNFPAALEAVTIAFNLEPNNTDAIDRLSELEGKIRVLRFEKFKGGPALPADQTAIVDAASKLRRDTSEYLTELGGPERVRDRGPIDARTRNRAEVDDDEDERPRHEAPNPAHIKELAGALTATADGMPEAPDE